MKKLIAGNWKMNGNREQAKSLITDIVNGIHNEPGVLNVCDFVVCPPFVHLGILRHSLTNVPHIALGGQDCAFTENGAYTGDVSPAMLKDMSCGYVILGHSERRQYHEESDETVRKKAEAAHAKGLITIICVGEGETEREAGRQERVVARQLLGSMPMSATAENTVIAYEPVWAIGTGKTATPEDVGAMHAFIREKLNGKLANHESLRILYGGSVKPDNAGALFDVPNVDGALIGGASLQAGQFLGIALAA